MSLPEKFTPDFQRYLQSKVTVDDRALNRVVFDALRTRLSARPEMIEIACGVGTMLTRLQDWGVFSGDETYLGVDLEADNIRHARRQNYLGNPSFRCADLFDLMPEEKYDLLIATAFLDLMPLERALPHLRGLLKPGGLAYFPINFDGVTLFHPAHPADGAVLAAYHDSMDERSTGGHSQTGRQLFSALPAYGFEILAAGGSDWVVHPVNGQYIHQEADFLMHILNFFEQSCRKVSELDRWLAVRRMQVLEGQLTFIAHQYDFLAARTR